MTGCTYLMLTGSIPVELGNLKRLEKLNIQKANLVGNVPQVIFNMSFLKSIDLRNNSLSGFSSQNMTCSTWLLEMRGIRKLILSLNHFTGNIPPEVGNLTQMKWLYLERSVPNEIGYLDDLEELDLTDNRFTGSFQFNISTLKKLHLTNNSFSGALPIDLGFRLPNLQGLFLSYNKFQGTLPSSIINASKLSQISIVSNSFTGSIPTTIGKLEHLETFVCGGNHFTTDGSELNFLSSLAHARKLRILSFAQNPLKTFLPASIGNWSTNLQTFQAHECGIKGNIPSGIGNLTNLQMLGWTKMSWKETSQQHLGS
ncbi:putative non-specific serine/threonine protein kinase [Helianthus annuus]|nr:putative non-specific serine/threonine protein kinase [Helianthus annuus]